MISEMRLPVSALSCSVCDGTNRTIGRVWVQIHDSIWLDFNETYHDHPAHVPHIHDTHSHIGVTSLEPMTSGFIYIVHSTHIDARIASYAVDMPHTQTLFFHVCYIDDGSMNDDMLCFSRTHEFNICHEPRHIRASLFFCSYVPGTVERHTHETRNHRQRKYLFR